MRAENLRSLFVLLLILLVLGGIGYTASRMSAPEPPAAPPLLPPGTERALKQMEQFELAIIEYSAAHGEVPSALDELLAVDSQTGEPFMGSIPLDPWDQPYRYRRGGPLEYRLLSTGEDIQEGTEDDVVSPSEPVGP